MLRTAAVVLLLLAFGASAQQVRKPMFKAIYMAATIEYSKDSLNKEMVDFKEKEKVITLLRSRRMASGLITIKISREQGESWWPFNVGDLDNALKVKEIRVQSGRLASSDFTSPDEMRGALHGTIAFIDSALLTLNFASSHYSYKDLYLAYGCQGVLDSVRAIPHLRGKLVFEPGLIQGSCMERQSQVQIFASNNPQKKLASFNLVFLSDDQKQMLVAIADDLQEERPGITVTQKAAYLSTYSEACFGRLFKADLVAFIKEKK